MKCEWHRPDHCEFFRLPMRGIECWKCQHVLRYRVTLMRAAVAQYELVPVPMEPCVHRSKKAKVTSEDECKGGLSWYCNKFETHVTVCQCRKCEVRE